MEAGAFGAHSLKGVISAAGWCCRRQILFSGSLYVVAFTSIRWVGAIPPFGRAAFLAGLVVLAWNLWQKKGERDLYAQRWPRKFGQCDK